MTDAQRADQPVAAAAVTYAPVHELLPHAHPRNPRRHDLDLIERLIMASGFHGVVTRQESTGYIVVGHGRLFAAARIVDKIAAGVARYVEWAELHPNDPVAQGVVPVEIKDLSDAEALEKLLGDNAASDKAWYDDEVLAQLLSEADASGILEGSGWSRPEMDQVIADAAGGADPDLDPSPQLGDYEYRVIIRARDERQQAELLERLKGEGLDVRALTS